MEVFLTHSLYNFIMSVKTDLLKNGYSQYVGIDGIIADLLGTGKMFINKVVVM